MLYCVLFIQMALLQWIQIFGVFALCLKSTNTLTATSLGKATNKVEEIQVRCAEDGIHLTVRLAQSFVGLLHARGFPSECVVQGLGERVISLSLPTTGCGVRLSSTYDDSLRWIVEVDVQFDRQLQLAADERRVVTCPAPLESIVSSDTLPLPTLPSGPDAVPPSTLPPEQSLTSSRQPNPPQPLRANRRVAALAEADFNAPTTAGGARFWMELEATTNRNPAAALVGEPVVMLIKSKLPSVMSMRVADCRAHDGTGDSPQRLSDSWGCSLEPQILPQFNYTRTDESTHVASAVFPAFKFPDRESLHLQCALLICRGQCPVARCPDGSWPLETQYSALPTGKVVGRLEVFNSIRVAAPGIELEASELDIDTFSNAAQRSESSARPLRRERSLCISPSRMALALAALGAVLLCAVAAALYTATRGRHRKSQAAPRLMPTMLGRPLPYVRVMH
ncbi:hypothetical protein B566_EDAN018269 [Ephemera danica]|nr:hypothetical protein B566_EDAN018269 [Ephemera danica]